jgi:hypothetical protein
MWSACGQYVRLHTMSNECGLHVCNIYIKDFEEKPMFNLETKHQVLKKFIGKDINLVTNPFKL